MRRNRWPASVRNHWPTSAEYTHKQAELGIPITHLCRQHGVSDHSFYRWKKIYSGMLPSEAREQQQLREENVKLKRLLADLSLDKVTPQDVVQRKR